MLPTVRAEVPAVTETVGRAPTRRSQGTGEDEQVTPVGGFSRDGNLSGRHLHRQSTGERRRARGEAGDVGLVPQPSGRDLVAEELHGARGRERREVDLVRVRAQGESSGRHGDAHQRGEILTRPRGQVRAFIGVDDQIAVVQQGGERGGRTRHDHGVAGERRGDGGRRGGRGGSDRLGGGRRGGWLGRRRGGGRLGGLEGLWRHRETSPGPDSSRLSTLGRRWEQGLRFPTTARELPSDCSRCDTPLWRRRPRLARSAAPLTR